MTITQLTEYINTLPVDLSGLIVITLSVISLVAGVVSLMRNRRQLASSEAEDDTDLGVLFDNPKSVLPHLLELRQRVIQALIGIVVAAVTASLLINPILEVLTVPIGGVDALTVIGVTEQVQVWFRISLTLGFILASPYVIAQIWIFIAAGLKRGERRGFYLMFPFAALMFVLGVLFAYFAMLPVAVPFLTTFLVEATVTLDSYVSFVTTVLLFVGLSFEMPLVIFVLAKLGVVNSGMLVRNWRIAIVLIAVLAAVITPTPDPINMGIVAAPLVLLYVFSIVLARFA